MVSETWTMDDERIRDYRVKLRETEDRLQMFRERLNDAIVQRRATLTRDDVVVCPVCGRVVGVDPGGVAPHDSDRKTQCRGTGLPLVIATIPMDGGL